MAWLGAGVLRDTCYPAHTSTRAAPAASRPMQTNQPSWLQAQPGSLGTWAKYYARRGLPSDSPAALLLDSVLTVHWALQRLQQLAGQPWPCAPPRPVVVHILGEAIVLYALFICSVDIPSVVVCTQCRLASLLFACDSIMPGCQHAPACDGTGQHVVPTAVGFTLALGTVPSISQHSHPTLPTAGWICHAGPQKEVQQWPLFLELGCLHPALRLHLHFVGPEVLLSADGLSLEVPTPVGRSCGAAGCSCQRAAAAPGLAEGQQAAGVDGGQQAQQGGSTRLMWHRGLYHDAAAALISGSGPPDLVVGANAGGWEHGVCFCPTFKSCP